MSSREYIYEGERERGGGQQKVEGGEGRRLP